MVKKINRASVTCGFTCIFSGVPEKEQENIWRNENSQFDGSYTPSYSSSMNSKQVKHKTPRRHTIIRLLATHDKRENLEIHQRRKDTVHTGRTRLRMTIDFPSQTM